MLERIFIKLKELVQSLIAFLKVMARSNLFVKKLSIESQSCFILGNGPSLNEAMEEHFDFLANQTLFCVNGFSSTEQFEKLKPQYYVINAPEFWSETSDGKNPQIRQAMIDSLIEKTSWKMTVFLPIQSKDNPKFTRSLNSNPNLSLHFFNTTAVAGLNTINHFFYSSGLGCPRPHNVLIPCLMIAINSGIKNIFLLGVDHSWLPLVSVDENNRALVNQQHFYDEKTSSNDPMYKLGKRPRRLHEILEKFYFSFRSYFEIKDFADKKNVNIYNCTPGSFIDAFDRKELSNSIKDQNILVEKSKNES